MSYRECNGCRKSTIPSSSKYWIRLCTECYVQSIRNPEYRACVVCNGMSIKKESPLYVTKCGRCYELSTMKCNECRDKLRHGERKVCGECVLLGSKHMLRCEECGVPNINYMLCSSLTVCEGCTGKAPKRQCVTCREYVIPETEASWIKVCKGCWIASKR